MSDRKKREELETGLKEAGDAIGRRIEALERSVRPGGLEKGRQLAAQPGVRLASVVLAGLAVGWILAGIGGKRRRRNRTADDWAREVAGSTRRRVEAGQEPESALRRALQDLAVDMPERGRDSSAGGWVSALVGYAVRPGVTALVQSLVREWSGRSSSTKADDPAD